MYNFHATLNDYVFLEIVFRPKFSELISSNSNQLHDECKKVTEKEN